MNAPRPALVPAAVPPAQWDALREPAVRDLAWLLFSADLLRAQPPVGMLASAFETQDELAATLDWLRALDAEPGALRSDLAVARVTRLGRYAECLLAWFLQHGPTARLIAANVPLRRAGLTLGECDFLVQTRAGRRLHWELAVKCYLHAGDGRGLLSDYVGPNLQDRFDLKLTHLLDHQLPLSGREEFATLGHVGPWEPQMFIKGWLFYRHGEVSSDPMEIDPAHARGWWATRTDWPAFAAEHAQAWRVLPRLEWLAPRRHEPGVADAEGIVFVDVAALGERVAHQNGPTMVAAFYLDDAGCWVERSRGFIVPDDWPQKAQAFARQ
ncbi:DUF1853 family protein [Paraburkholderia phenazinium]|uniref:DUF1853 family protein n=1 Tax=Paraburkholderia phenazinium TaxID=60549 RepID=A0A1G8LAU6_9BURK|nr:DUF1853 family protein [Paraburkholderia phenazinium]SDI52340.1 hypothetical protein SAMN05216466_12529 [Paraburkholderia phenazinium]